MRTVIPKNSWLVPDYAQKVFKGVIYDVYQWQQKMFDGTLATFERLKRPDTVRVLVIKDNKLILIEDEQPKRQPILTIPGGRHDIPSEDELTCAKRELLEETGLVCDSWKLLDVRQPVRKIDWFVYVFLAYDVSDQLKPNLDSGEKIKVLELEFDQALQKFKDLPEERTIGNILQKAGSAAALKTLTDVSKDQTKTVLLGER